MTPSIEQRAREAADMLSDEETPSWEFIRSVIEHCLTAQHAEDVAAREKVNPSLVESFSLMTQIVRIKYGNSDPAVYAEIEKAEKLISALSATQPTQP